MTFLVSFMIPWNVEEFIPPPIMPPPIPPPMPLMVITPSFIWNVIWAEDTGPELPIIWENVSFPLPSITECPYVQSREPGLPEDTACITQSPVMSEGDQVPAVSFIRIHISGSPPKVSVATIMDLSIDMTP